VNQTVHSSLRSAVRRLEAAGIDTPRLDAELLLAHVLGTNRTSLFAHPERSLADDEAARFEAVLRRREAREPLPYITGVREFLGLPFRVTPAVLIPRPETETLVESVVEHLGAAFGREHSFRLLDVGAGSGCIAVGLARLLPRATVVAVEPSPDALEVARQNAEALGVAERLEWFEGPFSESVADMSGAFDAIASNPPYIPAAEIEGLQPEVRDWEPQQALTAGPDGTALIRALVEHAPRLLRREGGLLALEVALGQAERVTELLRADGRYHGIETVTDLAGVPRVCLAWVGRAEPMAEKDRDELHLDVEEYARVKDEEIQEIQAEFEPLDADIERLMESTDPACSLEQSDGLHLRLHRRRRSGVV
jgi:release factor glutamine methyltransferase